MCRTNKERDSSKCNLRLEYREDQSRTRLQEDVMWEEKDGALCGCSGGHCGMVSRLCVRVNLMG